MIGNITGGNKSRRHLADSKLGMKYKERLDKTEIRVKKGRVKLKEYENGYIRIER